jgi:hypothetical protein
MVVVEEVGEGLLADLEARVLSLVEARGLRQPKADLRQPDETRIFGTGASSCRIFEVTSEL